MDFYKYKNKYLRVNKKVGGGLISENKFNYISDQINISYENLFDNELFDYNKLFRYRHVHLRFIQLLLI